MTPPRSPPSLLGVLASLRKTRPFPTCPLEGGLQPARGFNPAFSSRHARGLADLQHQAGAARIQARLTLNIFLGVLASLRETRPFPTCPLEAGFSPRGVSTPHFRANMPVASQASSTSHQAKAARIQACPTLNIFLGVLASLRETPNPQMLQ